MKLKMMIGSLAGFLLFGGVVGASSFSDDSNKYDDKFTKKEYTVTVNENKVSDDDDHFDDKYYDDHHYDDSYYKHHSSHSQIQNQKAKISLADAIAIATKNSKGKVDKAKLDDNSHYEIEIKTGSYEIEYKIDAYTGKVIKKEVEKYDD